jgi:hypothetical protein
MICVAENGSSDGYWGFPIDPGFSPSLYPGGLGWPMFTTWSIPTPLQRELRSGDVTILSKYTKDIGISSYGQPSSTNIAYPTVAGMTIPHGDFSYPQSIPYSFSQTQATRNWPLQNMEWLTGGTIYDTSYMNFPMWPSSIFSPTPQLYGGRGKFYDSICGPYGMGCRW